MHTLDQLNTMSPEAFVAALDGVFEYADWVAEAGATQRPFASVSALHDALMAVVHAAPADTCVGFLRGHPPLSPKALAGPGLTASSRDEQGGLGMSSLGEQLASFEASSTAYEARFGFPFIVAVKGLDRAAIIARCAARLASDRAAEIHTALDQVARIARFRLEAMISG